MKWISVEDELPEDKDEKVLLYFEFNGAMIVSYKGHGIGKAFTHPYYTHTTVSPTHWMPLPEKPFS